MSAEFKPIIDFSNQSLYQQALLEHHKQPVGFNKAITITHSADGINAACGDEIVVQIHRHEDDIVHIAFCGDSCAICRASASIMCQSVEGKNVSRAIELAELLIQSLSHSHQTDIALYPNLHPIFAVQKFPVRKQCAILPWQTFALALKQGQSL
ncbi:Fe-S cluster assembly sulfur transfer protein SufU [Thalassotalea ganghwensis]